MTTQTRVRILHDEDAQDPRQNDNLGTMACWHRRYRLGDVQPTETPDEYLAGLPDGSIVLPLFLFDHSGLSISTTSAQFRAADSVGWDWGQVGVIHVSPMTVQDQWGTVPDVQGVMPLQRAINYLIGEVTEYDHFLRGDAYGYIIERAEIDDEYDDEDEDIAWEHVDSCWGFLGADPLTNGMSEYVPSELHAQLKAAANHIES